jgi:hypothetical protein
MGKKKNAGKPPKIQGRGSLCLQSMLLKMLALAAPADTALARRPAPDQEFVRMCFERGCFALREPHEKLCRWF